MPVLGCCAGFYPQLHAAVPGCTDRRIYYNAPNGWPQSWPLVEGSTATISIRPFPGDLLAGKLDDHLRAFLAGAPAGCRLAAFHECSNLSDYQQAPWISPEGKPLITAGSMHQVNGYLRDFCHTPGNNPNGVGFGVIMCCPPASMPPWMVEGLDWYGLDIYDWPEFHHGQSMAQPLDVTGALVGRFQEWYRVCQDVSGVREPHMCICETNSGTVADRPAWLTAVAGLLGGFPNGRVMDTFWSDLPRTVGPFDPGDAATIKALAAIRA